MLIGGTLAGGAAYATYDVGFQQGLFYGDIGFNEIDWGRTGQAFRTGANTGLFVSSFIAGGYAYRAAGIAAKGLKGWQAFRALAPYNAVDFAWGAGVDMALNGQSFGSATFWNAAAFGAGELLGPVLSGGARVGRGALRFGGRQLGRAGGALRSGLEWGTRRFDLNAVTSGFWPIPRRFANYDTVPDVVYRNPDVSRVVEHPGALLSGFHPKDPTATYKPLAHVSMGNKLKTQYISFSRDFYWQIAHQQPGVPLYVVDLNKAVGRIYDFTITSVLDRYVNNPVYKPWARRASEVLVEGHVPPAGILGIIPYDEEFVRIANEIIKRRPKG